MLLEGKLVAQALDEATARQCGELQEKGIKPCLAILRIGERADDLSYERARSSAARR